MIRMLLLESCPSTIFVFGPSHHHGTGRCLISNATYLETPLGNLTVNASIRDQLMSTGLFELCSQAVDEAEHSIELHLPYIAKLLGSAALNSQENPVTIIPIIVGNLSSSMVDSVSSVLSPYFQDPRSLFVISR